MAGLAKTNQFVLSTASVMIGAPEDLHDLNPTEHSIGLVKNFTINAEPQYTDLTQGVKNSIVFSVLTSNPVRANMEVYEYTAKNVSYSLGLDGGSVATQTTSTTTSAPVAASPATDELPVVSATGITQDKFILIEKDGIDDFIVRKVASVLSNTLTLDRELPAIPSGAKVSVVNGIDIGSKEDQPFFSAKIAGKLADGTPVVILIPKIRITNGFNVSFTTDDFGNLPFEFTVYDVVSTDPMYSEFKNAQARMFKQ